MLTKNISLKSFLRKGGEKKIKKRFKSILVEKNELFNSMSKNYNDSFNSQRIKKICSKKDIRIIGMGGSILGTQAIYFFLKDKIKKKFYFINNLEPLKKKMMVKKKLISLFQSLEIH